MPQTFRYVLTKLVTALCCVMVCSTAVASIHADFTDPQTSGSEALDQIIDFVNKASSTLDVAIYTFTYDRQGAGLFGVALALQNARARGVQVRVVTDEDEVNYGSNQFLLLDIIDGARDNNLNPAVVRYGNAQGIMHDKFMVADGNRVLMGSANFTSAGLFLQENNVLTIESTAVAAAYSGEFNQMWSGTYGNNAQPKPQHNFIASDGTPVEIWFGADDDLTGRIVSAINSATDNIYFAMSVFSLGTKANQIATALHNAASRGIDVRGVLDEPLEQWENLSGYPNISMGDYIGPGGLMHNKMCIIDAGLASSVVLTGSNNWSTSADERNDENMAIVGGPLITNTYYDQFRRVYVERSSDAGGTSPIRAFGDLTGDAEITIDDYEAALAIASGSVNATHLQIITGDVAPVAGGNGHLFGDGAIDYQDAEWLARHLGLPVGDDEIGFVLTLADGAPVATSPAVVTAAFGTTFYIQKADRASGIRVQGAAVNQGDTVSLAGEMSTMNLGAGERFIQAQTVRVHSSGSPLPEPLHIQQPQLGGSDVEPNSPGVTGAESLYNIGLRIRSTGTVTGLSPVAFWIDDGSALEDGSGNCGVKVASGALPKPPLGSIVQVTGISSMDRVAGRNVRVIRPSSAADMIQLHP